MHHRPRKAANFSFCVELEHLTVKYTVLVRESDIQYLCLKTLTKNF